METLLEMQNISKNFPGVKALDNVCFDVRPGEVMALVGANGAGKSTLLKIATGVYMRDSGKVFVRGKEVHFKTPEEGKESGIAAIYQELTVIPNLTVAENIYISEIKNAPVIRYKKFNKRAERLLKDLDVSFKATDKVSNLTVANQQMVEIARALTENAKLLIMDEPTSALTANETDKLFSIVKSLKLQGIGIVFVTHRIKEIFEISDRATVMKDGKLVGCYHINELTEEKLVELMIARRMSVFYPKKDPNIGDVILTVKNLKKGEKVKDVTFNLRKGEILGLTGLLGSGRTEVARCLFGLDRPERGEISFKGKKLSFQSPVDAVSTRFALVPEDRKAMGLILRMGVGNNICFGSKVMKAFRSIKKEAEISQEYVEKLNVKCTGIKQPTGTLSGGNQQKVIMAKWLLRDAEILILDEPTRGIDVSAKAEIYTIISTLASQGTSIIMISSEEEEIIGMCDRAVVLYEGTSVGVINRAEFSEERILQMSHNLS
ncbi:MAG: sugar ABC transporter ATP-binding protein [Christensenellales bacterium]